MRTRAGHDHLADPHLGSVVDAARQPSDSSTDCIFLARKRLEFGRLEDESERGFDSIHPGAPERARLFGSCTGPGKRYSWERLRGVPYMGDVPPR